MASDSNRAALLTQLQQCLNVRKGDRPAKDDTLLSTGCTALDSLFQGEGIRRGTILEWLSPGPGSGVSVLALGAMRQVLAAGGGLVLCDREAALAPPALQALGVNIHQAIVVRAKSVADHRWAIDQALRSPAVAVVWARLTRLDDKTSRRFQLAAERGGAIGLFIRPAEVRGQPTWAELQLAVTPLAGQPQRTWRVECARARGPTTASVVEIGWEETTGTLRAVQVCHDSDPLPLATRLVRTTRA